MKDFRSLVNVLILLVLTGLAAVVLLNLLSLYKDLEASAQEVAILISGSEFSLRIDEALVSIAEAIRSIENEQKKGSDEPKRRSDVGEDEIEIIPSHLMPRGLPVGEDFRDASCADLMQYGRGFVSFSCVSFAVYPFDVDWRFIEAEKILEELDIANHLAGLYPSWQQKGIESGALDIGSGLPPFIHIYANLQTPAGVVGAIFPASHAEKTFDITQRPWSGPGREVGDFIVSPLYHDHKTRKLVVSLLRKQETDWGTVLLGLDYRVPYSSHGSDIYLLNAVMLLIGLAIYLTFFLRTRLQFEKYLTLSTAFVFLAYLVLLLNEILVDFEYSVVSNRSLLNMLLPFFPSGSLLLVAAVALIKQRRPHYKYLLVFYLVEGFAAWMNIVFKTSFFSALFACVTLAAFGACVRIAGMKYSRKEETLYESLNPHPYTVSRWVAIAYAVWGLAQFSVLLLSDSESRYISGLVSWGILEREWIEILMTEPGSVMLLLYPKGVAIFFTVLFLLSLEFARFRKRLQTRGVVPFLQVDESGRIIGWQQFPESPEAKIGEPFTSLIADGEDREEIEYVLRNDVETRFYLCRIPRLAHVFGESLIQVTLDRTDTWGYPRRAWLYPVDRSKLPRDIDRQFCDEVGRYLQELENRVQSIRVDNLADLTMTEGRSKDDMDALKKDLVELSSLIQVEGREIIEKTRQELLLLKGEDFLRHTKTDISEAWNIARTEVESFCERHQEFTFSVQEVELSAWPRRLRLNADLLRLALKSLLVEVRRAGGSENKVIGISLGETRLSRADMTETDAVSLEIKLPFSQSLRGSLLRLRRPIGGTYTSEEDAFNWNLLIVKKVLEFFDGDMYDRKVGDSLVVSLSFRYLFSTWRRNDEKR